MSILKYRKTHRKAPVKKTFLAKFIGFKFATLLKAEFITGFSCEFCKICQLKVNLFRSAATSIEESQLTFACSKPVKETMKKGVDMFKVKNKNFEHISHLFLVFLLLTLNK